ncbi:MAG TPA: hypothetical protein VGC56_15575 [Allosphingosinicella sp.]|jgi:hypothetical protein
MLKPVGAVLLLLAAGGAAPPRPAQAPPPGYGTVIIREQIVVRITRGPAGPALAASAEWKEKKGPKCVPAKMLAGAAVSGPQSVDFLLQGGGRVRARFEADCPALGYYYGFYIAPNPDGMVCAERDAIRSRIGGQCDIHKFRSLKPR